MQAEHCKTWAKVDWDAVRFWAWRRGKTVAAAAVLAVVVAAWVGTHLRHRDWPAIETIERSEGVWARPPERAVLQGRPLIRRAFTRDAATGDDVFYVWYDERGHAVAFVTVAWEPPNAAQPDGREFYGRYIGGPPWANQRYQSHDELWDVWRTRANGYDIEVARSRAGGGLHAVLVKTRHWRE